ncbi:hypothetical protein F5Y16DRAFT_381184 [Xylariaceae sp. FL0255]|nr:hypothetical protein F5Y16DRAFT_381184 [Xylariaceae sp. FL0255]
MPPCRRMEHMSEVRRCISCRSSSINIFSRVKATAPCSSDTANFTTNAQDLVAPDSAIAMYDPLADYVYLGDKLSDGLLSFVTIGIDTAADYTANVIPASIYFEDGGVDTGIGGLPPGGLPLGGVPPSFPPPGNQVIGSKYALNNILCTIRENIEFQMVRLRRLSLKVGMKTSNDYPRPAFM